MKTSADRALQRVSSFFKIQACGIFLLKSQFLDPTGSGTGRRKGECGNCMEESCLQMCSPYPLGTRQSFMSLWHNREDFVLNVSNKLARKTLEDISQGSLGFPPAVGKSRILKSTGYVDPA